MFVLILSDVLRDDREPLSSFLLMSYVMIWSRLHFLLSVAEPFDFAAAQGGGEDVGPSLRDAGSRRLQLRGQDQSLRLALSLPQTLLQDVLALPPHQDQVSRGDRNAGWSNGARSTEFDCIRENCYPPIRLFAYLL